MRAFSRMGKGFGVGFWVVVVLISWFKIFVLSSSSSEFVLDVEGSRFESFQDSSVLGSPSWGLRESRPSSY